MGVTSAERTLVERPGRSAFSYSQEREQPPERCTAANRIFHRPVFDRKCSCKSSATRPGSSGHGPESVRPHFVQSRTILNLIEQDVISRRRPPAQLRRSSAADKLAAAS